MTNSSTQGGGLVRSILLNPILLSLLLAVAIVVGIIKCLEGWLDSYTEHGVTKALPNLVGKNIDEANHELQACGFDWYCVRYDSAYVSGVKRGGIFKQLPEAGEKVKRGHKILVYTNSNQARRVDVPPFENMPLRQCLADFESRGLLTDVEYVPSHNADIVLDAVCQGRSLSAGDKVYSGSTVTLKVGRGMLEDVLSMPSLRGLTLPEAEQKMEALKFNCKRSFDVTPSSEANQKFYVVYAQSPLTQARLNGDEVVTLFLTTDHSKLEGEEQVASEAE